MLADVGLLELLPAVYGEIWIAERWQRVSDETPGA
jgi:hypothetical protein